MTTIPICNTISHMENRKRTTLNIVVPKEDLRFLEKTAKDEGKTKSELAREALRIYTSNRKLDGIQKYGRKLALKLGIETLEDVERIAG